MAASSQPPGGGADEALALRVQNVSARYVSAPRLALADVSLHLRSGEKLLLVGPNGAGKSTLLRLCAGLMAPDKGDVSVFSLRPAEARRQIGVVAHSTYLYDELTAAENLRLYGALYAVPDPRQRSVELLGRLGLGRVATAPAGQLSRGQQQRLAIARALLHDPPLLLLDEPETGLDVSAFALLEQLAADPQRTLAMTTHHVREGLRLATRVVLLAQGRVVDDSPAARWGDGATLEERLRDLARIAVAA